VNLAKQAEAILFAQPEISGVLGGGIQLRRVGPNAGLMFTRLKRWTSAGEGALVAGGPGPDPRPLFGLPGGLVVPFAPPPIQGLSAFGGFEFQVLDQTGGDLVRLQQVTQELVGAANSGGKVTGLFSASGPTSRSCGGDRPRPGPGAGAPMHEITDALQVFLGSQYVNDSTSTTGPTGCTCRPTRGTALPPTT